jgi:hypothetical protein
MSEGEMLSPEQLQMDRRDLGWPPGAMTLRQLRGDNVPLRLAGEFFDRPWPHHSLYMQLIDLSYATWIPPYPPEECETVYIVDNYRIARNKTDSEFALGTLQVALMNVGLLAGEFYLGVAEIDYLFRRNRPKLISQELHRFDKQKGGGIFETKRASMGRERLVRLNQRLRFIDLRQENKKGIPEFIG